MMRDKWELGLAHWLLAVLFSFTSQAIGQENEPASPETSESEKSPELRAAEERVALLEQQLLMAQKQKELVQAYLPTLPEPLSGEAKVEGDTPIETHILAYQAVSDVADEIKRSIGDVGKNKALVIYSEKELNSILFYRAFLEQIKILEQALDVQVKQRDVPIAPMVSGVFGFGLEVLTLFRKDLTLASKEISVNHTALVAEIASRFTDRTVYHPELFPPYLTCWTATSSEMMNALSRLAAFPKLVHEAIAKLNERKEELQKEIEKEEAEINKKKKECEAFPDEERKRCEGERDEMQGKLDGKRSEIQASSFRIKELESVQKLYESFRASLLATDEVSGLSLLTQLIRAENLLKIMRPPTGCAAFTLLVEPVQGGGSVKTSRSIFRTTVGHSGGVVVTYLLFNPVGRLVKSGTLACHGGFRRLKKWKQD